MNTRHELFAQAKARGESNTQAAISAGYSQASAHNQGTRLIKNDAIRARFLELAGVAEEFLGAYMADTDPKVRSSAVRSAELVLRAAGVLQAENQIQIDARTVVLEGSESLSVAELERLAASLEADTSGGHELPAAERAETGSGDTSG